ncbi:DUF3100 domain-containing protein [Psychrobacillus soli]|uniref:DUF3100 domain-containing protein n=1 Tax=Psychrobacillus soli TaxID=1543965 RepID=A0A544T8G6_9BACI|nr:DUF3100 domain-containing protein [Psychrobacillus soli]TQR13756.1 DUF3100 domain-containing protein [Psychrobacillus soli]
MRKDWKLHIIVLFFVFIGEAIGVKQFNLGVGTVALFPMLYVLLMGGIVSFPKLKWMNEVQMKKAAGILGISFMLFVAKLGSMLGPSLPKIFEAGASLAVQEIGHVIGTIIIGLPIALLLGMKRESIGATFSIDREPNLAIISEKYGADSPEGRGALGVYICGTVFGAIYLALLAGFLGSLGIFHPISLAMGAGVGSGSMMAAASGALAVTFPNDADDIALFAAAANLITTILGTYICVFFSLPVTARLYEWLEPIIGRKSKEAEK